jgi:glycosyltransferase involved in cell wall biosynthesis
MEPNVSFRGKVAVAMLGARMHYAVPRFLFEAGLLSKFYTDSYIGNKPRLRALFQTIPLSIRPKFIRQWLGRSDTVLPPSKVTSFEFFGLWYAVARRRARTQQRILKVYDTGAKLFAKAIEKRGLDDCVAVWGFNTASLELFQLAKEKRLLCFLEQTILPERLAFDFMSEEHRRRADWAVTSADDSLNRAFLQRIEREEAEWALADKIFVGSEFVREGLLSLGVPSSKVCTVNYGVDIKQFPARERRDSKCPLRVLFVGEVGLRKGAPDLLEAFDQLPAGRVELRLAGSFALTRSLLDDRKDRVSFLGIVPRNEVAELYSWADVFVLPSIVEGSATVTYEALVAGLPVIATPNAGSIVEDGVNGFIVPIRNPSAIASAIMRYAVDRDLLLSHQSNAERSREAAGVEKYKQHLVRIVKDVLQENSNLSLDVK